MPHDPNQDLTRLEDFLASACPELGIDAADVPVADVLGLSTDVARGVMRPGVPVTAYALGLAVGRGLAPDEAIATLRRAIDAYVEAHGPDPARRH